MATSSTATGSLRLRKTSSHSSQRHSFRDEELVVKVPAVSARAKSRFAEPRKPSDPKSGSPRRSGGMRSCQLRSGPQRSQQQVRSGNLNEEDDPFKDVDLPDRPKSQKQWSWGVCFEWIALFILLGAVVCSRVIPQAKHVALGGLLLWKWILLALVIVCGRLVSGWGVRILVFILELNFLTRRRVLYFVYAVQRSVRNCIWLALVLISWNSMFDSKAQVKAVAKEIFENVHRPGVPYIIEDDLMRFMPDEDAIRALALCDGAMEMGKIAKKALKSWVVYHQQA